MLSTAPRLPQRPCLLMNRLSLFPQRLYFPLQLFQPCKHGIGIDCLPHIQNGGSDCVQTCIHTGKPIFHAFSQVIHAGIDARTQGVDARIQPGKPSSMRSAK